MRNFTNENIRHCCPPGLGNPLSSLHKATQRHAKYSYKKNWEMKRSNKRINKELSLTVVASTILLSNALSVGCSSDDGLLLFFVVTLYFKYLIIMNSFSIDCSGSDHKELIWHAMNVICIHIKKKNCFNSRLINTGKCYCFCNITIITRLIFSSSSDARSQYFQQSFLILTQVFQRVIKSLLYFVALRFKTLAEHLLVQKSHVFIAITAIDFPTYLTTLEQANII